MRVWMQGGKEMPGGELRKEQGWDRRWMTQYGQKARWYRHACRGQGKTPCCASQGFWAIPHIGTFSLVQWVNWYHHPHGERSQNSNRKRFAVNQYLILKGQVHPQMNNTHSSFVSNPTYFLPKFQYKCTKSCILESTHLSSCRNGLNKYLTNRWGE